MLSGNASGRLPENERNSGRSDLYFQPFSTVCGGDAFSCTAIDYFWYAARAARAVTHTVPRLCNAAKKGRERGWGQGSRR